MIRILLADDHAMLRDALAALLQAQDGLRVIGQAGDGREAVRAIADCQPEAEARKEKAAPLLCARTRLKKEVMVVESPRR
jgi:chemotaxis response regulator CheB